ncbi:MAG: NADH-quinone oxidoreductase subunit C [Niabella sp.]
MAVTNDIIKQQLVEKFAGQVSEFEEPYGLLTFTADKEIGLKVLNFLSSDESLGFTFLTDICGVHFPNQKGKELCVVYHLHNMMENVRIRMKLFTDIEKPEVYTVTGIFSCANWMERETFDFFGINFIGHPNMKRILNVDEMDYSPLRKEFPLEDQSRIDKDDEMFGRGGVTGFGDAATIRGTIAQDEK